MREKAATLPLVKLEQATVLGLVEEAVVVRGVRYRTGDGVEQEAKAPLTFVCDGCFSNLRRKLCEPKMTALAILDHCAKGSNMVYQHLVPLRLTIQCDLCMDLFSGCISP